ncbi:MAG: GAF domain-containing protein [Chloroflexi bacterium]|nr:GAF domain-containing protein [Chloroflexota bacterium]
MALTQVARAIVGRSSAAEVAQIVVDEVRQLAPADWSAVALWDAEPERLQLLAVAGECAVPGMVPGVTLPLGDPTIRAVLERGRSYREADLAPRSSLGGPPVDGLLPGGPSLAAAGLHARLVVPVLVGDAPVGVLVAASCQRGVYTVAHERLLEHLAVHLAVGVEQARLLADARRQQARLLGLQRVAQRLAVHTGDDDVLDMVLEEAVRSVGAERGTLLGWDQARQVLTPLCSTPAMPPGSPTDLHGWRVAERAIREQQVVILPTGGLPGSAGPTIGAPLVADGRLLGAVTAHAPDPCHRFDAADAQIFELYAGQAAGIVASVRQFEAERRQRRGAEEVARAAAVIVAEADRQRRFDLIVERAVTIVGGVAGGLSLRDPTSGMLVVLAAHGYPMELRGRTVPQGRGVSHRVIAERGPVLLGDYAADVPALGYFDHHAFGPTIGVPVSARGQILGTLVIQAPAGAPAFDGADVLLLQTVADLAAVAVEHARALAREEERSRQVDAVRTVTTELTRELDLPALLDLILTRTCELMRCEAVSVLLWDEASEALVSSASCGVRVWPEAIRIKLGEGVSGLAAARREGIVVEAYQEWSGRLHPFPDTIVPTSVMATPMLVQDRLVGVLTANRLEVAEPFNQHDLELLDVFGAQAAIALDHAHLFEQATAAEALRELARLKSELLNTVSHELRTPLSLIYGYAELLVHRAAQLSTSEIAQMSGEIHQSARILARLVDDLLDFSDLDHGRLTLHRAAVPLTDLLEGSVRSFQAQPGGERIGTELAPGLVVDADPARLHQIVANLLSNALAYAPDGPILVRVARSGEAVRIEVVDRGPGLGPEEIGRVWESFYRGAQAAVVARRGSGLGLSVVKRLVDLHGGEVGVESAQGQGATFWFTLPTT